MTEIVNRFKVVEDSYSDKAKEVLQEAANESPDTVIALLFFKSSGNFKIKCSPIQDRLTILGAIEEAKMHILNTGYVE